MEPVIEARGLTKRYRGGARGVDDVTFRVEPGEVYGFLGPNGSGKTTTIRLLLDLLRPTAGEARVLGMDPRADAPRIAARVGYLPGEQAEPSRLTAREQLHYAASLRGGVDPARVAALAARVELDLDRPLRAMSSGNKRKVGIVEAFMHDPEILVLDEPTNGLDPLIQQEFLKLVREARAAGRAVFLSSHILSEVEALCDRVAIVREGKLVAVERMDAIKQRAVRRGRARFSGDGALGPRADALASVAGVSDARVEGDAIAFVVRGPTGPVVKALAAMDVADVSLREPTLEDMFLGYYGEAPPRG